MNDMIVETIKTILTKMDKRFTDLSNLKFDELNGDFKKRLEEQKIQERPFAYEFYHQFRKLWDDGSIKSFASGEDIVIQAEVNKKYQAIPELEKIPDFLLHKPNTSECNFAVLEFRLANNFRNIISDFEKLIKFKNVLEYKHIIEIVIGEEKSLESAKEHIENLNSSEGDQIIIVEFNTKTWGINDFNIKYKARDTES